MKKSVHGHADSVDLFSRYYVGLDVKILHQHLDRNGPPCLHKSK